MAENDEIMQPGKAYLAPPDPHMTVGADRSLAFTNGRKIRHVRSSANPLFESLAETQHGRVIAVVLTGFDRDGTDGVQTVNHTLGGDRAGPDELRTVLDAAFGDRDRIGGSRPAA